MIRKCQMCHGLLDGELTSTVSVSGPEDDLTMNICEICAAAVREFIIEYMDDVRTGFREQDTRYRLRSYPHTQKKLEAYP